VKTPGRWHCDVCSRFARVTCILEMPQPLKFVLVWGWIEDVDSSEIAHMSESDSGKLLCKFHWRKILKDVQDEGYATLKIES